MSYVYIHYYSVDDIIDRYRSEVIIDGVTLGAPILQVRLGITRVSHGIFFWDGGGGGKQLNRPM